ncbi:ParB/RepB/Spo0J family partition protein [Galbibacter mesophilus]|nr:ParB/RepB/Spo0J family partition protein [Galbibacter mesophilus]
MLSDSIREHGVLQPITVRKKGRKFIIVMGERRYRASKLAERKTIPCIVMDFKDGEVLEVQIIENLQRKEVEPTEEAEAIAHLSKAYSPGEISKRLGRTENFVRQRLKLAGLIEGFKEFVRIGEMTLSLGIRVALFEPGEQQWMMEALEGNFDAYRVERMVRDKTFDLLEAPFDIGDAKLVEKAGACTECPFNSANQGNLFGEDRIVCTKIACFENKRTNSLLNLIDRCKKDGVLLIPDFQSYWAREGVNQLIISQMENHGFKVYFKNDVEIMSKPVKPTMERIKQVYGDATYSVDGLKEKLSKSLEQYTEELKIFEGSLDNGYRKGIVFHPKSFKVKEALVKVLEVNDKDVGSVSVPLEKRKMADCTPEEQIIKIQDREVRKKQIENNRQFEEVVDMVRQKGYIDVPKELSKDEMVAFSILLYENFVDYMDREEHFEDLFGNSNSTDSGAMAANFRKHFSTEVFQRLVRYSLSKKVHLGESNHTNNPLNICFYQAVKAYFKEDVKNMEDTYDKERRIRERKLKGRIKSLKDTF